MFSSHSKLKVNQVVTRSHLFTFTTKLRQFCILGCNRLCGEIDAFLLFDCAAPTQMHSMNRTFHVSHLSKVLYFSWNSIMSSFRSHWFQGYFFQKACLKEVELEWQIERICFAYTQYNKWCCSQMGLLHYKPESCFIL